MRLISKQLLIDQGDGIYTIDTGFMRPGLVASHLIKSDDHAVFIDVGVAQTVPALLAALKNLDLKPENIDAVIVTHVHLDHAGGAGLLLQQLPNARLIVHPRGARHMIDPARLNASATSVYGAEKMKQLFGELIPVDKDRVIIAEDGFVFKLKQRQLLFMDTPGHARHHFCVVDESSQSVFTGDAFGLSYRSFDTALGEHMVPTTTPTQFDPEEYHKTIERITALNPRQLFLAHFGRVKNIERAAALLHQALDRYVECVKQVSNETVNRKQKLIELLSAALIQSLAKQNCRIEKEEIEEIMKMDLDLNAQGLLAWIDRQKNTAQ